MSFYFVFVVPHNNKPWDRANACFAQLRSSTTRHECFSAPYLMCQCFPSSLTFHDCKISITPSFLSQGRKKGVGREDTTSYYFFKSWNQNISQKNSGDFCLYLISSNYVSWPCLMQQKAGKENI
jgi:hypothetical protein